MQRLQTGYRYTLAPGAFRTGDPLAEFLFEKRFGGVPPDPSETDRLRQALRA